MSNEPLPLRDAEDAGSETDEQLIALVKQYQRPLMAYATRILHGDSNRAADAVQETLLRLCRADRESIRGHEAAWLFKVCRTRVIDMQRTKVMGPLDVETHPPEDRQPGPEAIGQQRDDMHLLGRLIDGLAPRQQEVLRLRLQAGLTYLEIAEVTGLERSAVGYHLHQAVRNLRAALVPGDE